MKRIDMTEIRRRNSVEARQLPDAWHPVLRRVLSGRGIKEESDLDTSLKGLTHVRELSGVAAAVRRLISAAKGNESILIIGDYDADGATSTAVAWRALRRMGVKNVGYLVPDRFQFGYGLTPEIVGVAKTKHPNLIVTVDNGISSLEGVEAARSFGIDVIVTDHHIPGKELPNAVAIVNPNLVGDKFPSKNLAGVGVIFYVMSALKTALLNEGWFETRKIAAPNLAELLDLVALGTVADVAVLDQNNRRLVANGIARIRAGKGNPGINALIEASARQNWKIDTADLGFAIGPRINAAGRMADMSVGIQCLVSDDDSTCQELAAELDSLNRDRREKERAMNEEAVSIAESLFSESKRFAPSAICIHRDHWHKGVLGITAARVKDRYYRPVVAFANSDDGTLTGSARSIEGLHIRDVLERMVSIEPDLILRFGGHAMAAGLSIRKSDLERFASVFSKVVEGRLGEDLLNRIVLTDGVLEDDELSLEFAEMIANAAPWGHGFPEPVFDGVFEITDRKVVGIDHAKLKILQEDGEVEVDAIAFGAAHERWFKESAKIKAAYKLGVNDYSGVKTLQILLHYVERVEFAN
jgi:single-stranded-DNA-specific exonuclease